MDGRLPIQSEARINARDRKLESREKAVAERRGRTHRPCPCNICLGQNHSRKTHGTIHYHLSTYGRHPYHRGSTQVITCSSICASKFPGVVCDFTRVTLVPSRSSQGRSALPYPIPVSCKLGTGCWVSSIGCTLLQKGLGLFELI